MQLESEINAELEESEKGMEASNFVKMLHHRKWNLKILNQKQYFVYQNVK